MSSEPKYSAYKPVIMTDGLQTWVQHTFDDTVKMTPDDIGMFASALTASTPSARIMAMQEKLNNLKNATSAMQLHSDAIRAIYAGIKNPQRVTPEELIPIPRLAEPRGMPGV